MESSNELIIKDDCIEGMKKLGDEIVDTIIADHLIILKKILKMTRQQKWKIIRVAITDSTFQS